MPKREPGEPLGKFISRFVKSKGDKKKWPNVKQRLAVGFSEAKRMAKHG